jgi:hypothetical protein
MRNIRNISLSRAVTWFEESIVTLSGPALAISGIIAGVDLLTAGSILKQLSWLAIVWAITLLLSLDFNVLALGVRAHRVYTCASKSAWRKVGEIALVVAIAAAVSSVSIQMQSVVARVNAESGVSIDQAAQQMGVNLVALTWERSALVMVLIFMSGWLRGSHQTSQPETRVPAPVPDQKQESSLSDETVQLILSKLAKLDALERTLATHQVTVTSVEEPLAQLPAPSETDRRASVPAVSERETEQPVQPRLSLLPTIDGVTADDVAKVIGAHLQGVARRDICSHLRWGSSKYRSIVKPVLDVWEQSRNTETAERQTVS